MIWRWLSKGVLVTLATIGSITVIDVFSNRDPGFFAERYPRGAISQALERASVASAATASTHLSSSATHSADSSVVSNDHMPSSTMVSWHSKGSYVHTADSWSVPY